MLTDKELKKKYEKVFSSRPEKYYPTKTMVELGFFRGKCKLCGRFFWSTDKYRGICGDSMCSGGFSFIGNTPAKKRIEYVDFWKKFVKILGKFGYREIKRYPVVARWRDDIFFVQASIDDFIPYIINGVVEPPANPLIVPQVCLRFNDIDNVGITGSHYTSFIMVGQHRFEKPENYKQDDYLKHLYEWFTRGMGLKSKDIILHEDVWAGSGNFGPSIEFLSRGLELANQVYMQFRQTPKGYEDLNLKVLDMGLGYERNVWFSTGKSTSYESTFPTIVPKLKKITGIKFDSDIFEKFLPFAGLLNIDEAKNVDSIWKNIAGKMDISTELLKETVVPLSALYSIAEHTRSLLFAINDGALPSNVGGGYNLRVLLRRCFSFIDRYRWNIDVSEVMNWHAKYLKPLFPELKEKIDEISKIIDNEKDKHKATSNKSGRIIADIINRGAAEAEIIKLYDSQGITPEMIKEVAEREKIAVKIPSDFYAKVSALHANEKGKETRKKFNIKGIEPTNLLFYQKQNESIFKAKVLKIIGNAVILDKTLFYPEGGGQEGDHGTINNCRVVDTQKQEGVVIHFVENPNFKTGDIVKAEVDMERRRDLSRHHTAIHIINLAARHVLGSHIFQAGSHKSADKAHLDITHYKPLSSEEIMAIEDAANRIVKKSIDIKVDFMLRNEAERRYGMSIYQGGAVPGKKIRIVSIGNMDIEACGGLHLSNTSEVGKIVIINAERIQDGIDRITIKAGNAAEKYLDSYKVLLKDLLLMLNEVKMIHIPDSLMEKMASPVAVLHDFKKAAMVFKVSPDQLNETVKRFIDEIVINESELEKLGTKLGVGYKPKEYSISGDSLEEIMKGIFETWKSQKKDIKKLRVYIAKSDAKDLLSKARNGMIFEIIHADRETMINIANSIIEMNKEMTVILVNENGDIIGMSRKDDMESMVSNICKKANGSGGGKKNFAQGRLELSKLLKIMEKG